MRERTLGEYVNSWRYFREWLNQYDPEVRFIQQIGAEHLRAYVDCMATKRKYSEVPNRMHAGETLSPYTVAFRLRILRTLLNFLHRENSRKLLRLIEENQRYFNSDYIFLSNCGEPLKADHFRKRLKLYAKAAGIPGELVSPHRFRSFVCRQFLLNGGDLFTLQRIVAHASIETTRRYVPINDEMIRQQHEHFSPLARMGWSRINNRRR